VELVVLVHVIFNQWCWVCF